MGVDVHARRLIRAQTQSQSDPLALSLSRADRSSSLALRAPPRISARPSRGSRPRRGRGQRCDS
eukprot:8158406-Pyramimonas_sp.AAC.1